MSSNSKSNQKAKRKTKKEKELDEIVQTIELQQVLFESEYKDENAERRKVEEDVIKRYYDTKTVVMKLEEKNNVRVYAFPSLNGKDDEWYKIGGKSALYYKYFLGPRMGRKSVKIHKDTDARVRFRHGTSSVHFGDKFIEAAAKVGYKAMRTKMGIIVVDLEKPFSVQEIKAMAETEKEDGEKLQLMLEPAENMPSLYAKIRELAIVITPKIQKMNAVYREVYGNNFLKITADLFQIYFRVANGREDKETGKNLLLKKVDDMTGMIALVDEIELFDQATRTRFGDRLVDVRLAIKNNFPEEKDGDESKKEN